MPSSSLTRVSCRKFFKWRPLSISRARVTVSTQWTQTAPWGPACRGPVPARGLLNGRRCGWRVADGSFVGRWWKTSCSELVGMSWCWRYSWPLWSPDPVTFAALGCSEHCGMTYRLKEWPPLTAASWMMSEPWPAAREDIMWVRPPSCCTSNLKVVWIYGHKQHVWLLMVKSEQPHPPSMFLTWRQRKSPEINT